MRKSLPVVILGLVLLLSMAAIEFLPATLYFPAVEYSAPENIRVSVLKSGELDKSGCEQSLEKLESAVRANCSNCKYAGRCSRGLTDEQKKMFSRDPLGVPSLRTRGGSLVMTISARDPQSALIVCKLAEQGTVTQPVEKRLTCFPAMTSR